jgi:hypothetical protein
MSHKHFKYSVDIRKIKLVILHISTEQFIRYIHIGFMVYVEEKAFSDNFSKYRVLSI